MIMNRRSLMTTALTLGAMKAFPGLSYAQARPLVFATFTGSWEEAHKAVLVPAFRKANADAAMVLDPMLSVDQIAKVNAAKANPPIDVMLHDPGPALVAIGQDLVEPYPVEKSAYYKDLIAEAQEPMGPAPFFQVVGLTYNPGKPSRRRRPPGPICGSPSSRAALASPTLTRRSAPAGWSRSPRCAAVRKPMSIPASRRSRS
ncbi:spermidine/putrescine-binding protein [Bradyrhizobium sp. GM0.4]